MNQPVISIIVPVNNAGCYLKKCLNSLIHQTLKEIEIILVIDCPTDGSDKIAEEFAATDNRIKLIYNKENLHTGLSRNKGMDIARGKYIGFHDHDDYSSPEMYDLLYTKAEQENADVTRCNFTCIYPTKNESSEEQYKYPFVSEDTSNKELIFEKVCSDKISCVIWNHIYKSEFLKKNRIKFLDSRTICSEDSIFFIEVYNKVHKVSIVPDYLYYHVFHTNNTGKAYTYRSLKNRISFFEELYSFLKRNGINKNQRCSFLSDNIIRSLYSGSRQALLSLSFTNAISDIGYINKSQVIRECINNLFKKNNLRVLFHHKPTVILFAFIVRLMGWRKSFL